ncbi:spore protease YyaC [Peribacillus frigoritolerans]|uniref:spore protease YyaC n=1 Tax=Peribacillus frigoritolerans TaxID=450367 RepID=UPI0010592857|nr:spore protease YyaC [Peribacillus frigoritolerans]TDL79312.1 spore protease YyaC [Peribacillus frigoritolerans]
MNFKSGFLKPQRDRIYYEDEHAAEHLSSEMKLLLSVRKPIVVLCIGTDRSTGDCLGPLVGTKLIDAGLKHFHVYGTLEHPVHAVNLEETIQKIEQTFDNPFILAIDACLGRLKSVGSFQVGAGPIKPGAGVNKVLPEVGDIHINGIVNVSGFMEFFVLQNTRLHLVMTMASIIAKSIILADQQIELKKISTKTKSSWLKHAKDVNIN